jgi:hypothetical protein
MATPWVAPSLSNHCAPRWKGNAFREILLVVPFSTFSTASVDRGHRTSPMRVYFSPIEERRAACDNAKAGMKSPPTRE